MKKFDDWFAAIIVIVSLIVTTAIFIGIANSNLPDWVKFVLLSR